MKGSLLPTVKEGELTPARVKKKRSSWPSKLRPVDFACRTASRPSVPYVPLRSPTPHFLPHPLPIISLNHALCDPFSWPRSSPPRAYPTHLPPLHPANQSRPDQASPLAATQRRNLSIHEYLAMNLMNDVSRA